MRSSIKVEYFIKYKGVDLKVVHGDITEEVSDAIVNAANEYLCHGGGVAGAISRKGGYRVQEESDNYISRHGPVKVGQVAVTSKGNLPCKYIIHAVGPMYRGGWNNESQLLRDSVYNSLLSASGLKLQSVSIPAISSGIFGYPKDLCANVLIASTLEFIDAHTFTSLKEIRFTNFDQETVMIVKNELIKASEGLNRQISQRIEVPKGKYDDTNSNLQKYDEDSVRKKIKLDSGGTVRVKPDEKDLKIENLNERPKKVDKEDLKFHQQSIKNYFSKVKPVQIPDHASNLNQSLTESMDVDSSGIFKSNPAPPTSHNPDTALTELNKIQETQSDTEELE